MPIERFITKKLIDWKNSNNRKPLIIRGERQVGKTYTIKEFGEKYYEGVAYFNFDYNEDLKSLFEVTKSPDRLLEQLSFVYGKKIIPGKTLIFFDEIQECPNALNSLKYFNEEANEYHIIVAGCLLEIRLSQTSFPVGKVQFLNMYPLTFNEFSIADNEKELVEYKKTIKSIEKIPDLFYNMLLEKLKAYMIIGGMPEVVNSWVNNKNIEKVNEIQKNLLLGYEEDFSKHTSAIEANRISLIWNSIPSQLSKGNKKFLYQVAKEGARAREYESALNWLNDANEIIKVYNVKKNNLQLKSYEDLSAFKIYMSDVGLLRQMSNLDSSIIIKKNSLFTEFKGALTENLVAQELTTLINKNPNYFTFDQYEIDFIIENKNEIIPIEVKSGENYHNTSLTNYNKKFDNKISVRFSLDNLDIRDKIINIPLFMIGELEQIIEIGEKEKK